MKSPRQGGKGIRLFGMVHDAMPSRGNMDPLLSVPHLMVRRVSVLYCRSSSRLAHALPWQSLVGLYLPLHNGTPAGFAQAVQKVRPLAHHAPTLRQILRKIIRRTYAIFLTVGKLTFNPVAVIAHPVQ